MAGKVIRFTTSVWPKCLERICKQESFVWNVTNPGVVVPESREYYTAHTEYVSRLIRGHSGSLHYHWYRQSDDRSSADMVHASVEILINQWESPYIGSYIKEENVADCNDLFNALYICKQDVLTLWGDGKSKWHHRIPLEVVADWLIDNGITDNVEWLTIKKPGVWI